MSTPITDKAANDASLCDQCVPAELSRRLELAANAMEEALRELTEVVSHPSDGIKPFVIPMAVNKSNATLAQYRAMKP